VPIAAGLVYSPAIALCTSHVMYVGRFSGKGPVKRAVSTSPA
jgi:hypothetical protein